MAKQQSEKLVVCFQI